RAIDVGTNLNLKNLAVGPALAVAGSHGNRGRTCCPSCRLQAEHRVGRVLDNGGAGDHYGRHWLATAVSLDLIYPAQDIEAADQLPEYGVIEVEAPLRAQCHEELRTIDVLPRVGHGQLA